jgi:hypothetical protein
VILIRLARYTERLQISLQFRHVSEYLTVQACALVIDVQKEMLEVALVALRFAGAFLGVVLL